MKYARKALKPDNPKKHKNRGNKKRSTNNTKECTPEHIYHVRNFASKPVQATSIVDGEVYFLHQGNAKGKKNVSTRLHKEAIISQKLEFSLSGGE